jgi:hypothetical protein
VKTESTSRLVQVASAFARELARIIRESGS